MKLIITTFPSCNTVNVCRADNDKDLSTTVKDFMRMRKQSLDPNIQRLPIFVFDTEKEKLTKVYPEAK
ncbi:MAG: hypothetical protein ACXABY_21245 [Candidatus Thorarchaeota archaeon]|jgi:hypothetical protein